MGSSGVLVVAVGWGKCDRESVVVCVLLRSFSQLACLREEPGQKIQGSLRIAMEVFLTYRILEDRPKIYFQAYRQAVVASISITTCGLEEIDRYHGTKQISVRSRSQYKKVNKLIGIDYISAVPNLRCIGLSVLTPSSVDPSYCIQNKWTFFLYSMCPLFVRWPIVRVAEKKSYTPPYDVFTVTNIILQINATYN